MMKQTFYSVWRVDTDGSAGPRWVVMTSNTTPTSHENLRMVEAYFAANVFPDSKTITILGWQAMPDVDETVQVPPPAPEETEAVSDPVSELLHF